MILDVQNVRWCIRNAKVSTTDALITAIHGWIELISMDGLIKMNVTNGGKSGSFIPQAPGRRAPLRQMQFHIQREIMNCFPRNLQDN